MFKNELKANLFADQNFLYCFRQHLSAHIAGFACKSFC